MCWSRRRISLDGFLSLSWRHGEVASVNETGVEAMIKSEVVRWSEVIRRADIKLPIH